MIDLKVQSKLRAQASRFSGGISVPVPRHKYLGGPGTDTC